jgi:pyruvate dehydrogenase E1 component
VPVVAVSDYVRAVPEQIRGWINAPARVLGTDGFGRSDTRARLRDFFEVSADWITLHALDLAAAEEPRFAEGLQRLRRDMHAEQRTGNPWQM